MFFPDIDPLIYFDRKLKGHHVIGSVDYISNTLFLDGKRNPGVDVRLFLITVYAAKAKYFKDQDIPLTYKEYKKKHAKTFPDFIPPQSLTLITEKGYKYIDESIKKNKEHFLVALVGQLYKSTEIKKDKYQHSPLDLYLTLIPIIESKKSEKLIKNERYGRFYNYFYNSIWEKITAEENEILMPQKDFSLALTTYGLTIYHLRNKNRLNNADLDRLNEIILSMQIRENPFTDFIHSFFDSFLESLQRQKLLKNCPVCKKVFPFKYNQVYCCYKCAKRKHHVRYYTKHRLEILPKAKERMQELRQFYKQKNVNK